MTQDEIRATPTHDEKLAEPAYHSGLWAGLSRNVIRMGWVSFLADISSEMLYPLVPIFLTTILGAPASVVGLIEGLAEAVASLLKTVSGRWSDRIGRKRIFVFLGYTLSALAKPLIGIATGWPLVLTARVTDRFGKGLRTSPRDALLADSASATMRGKAFGWHRAMDTMGAVLGPLLALLLVSVTSGDLRLVFLLAFIPGILGALLVLTLREKRRAPQATPSLKVAYQSLPVSFRRYLWAWAIFSVANSSDVFLILRAQQVDFSTILTVLVYTFYNLVYALGSPILGQLSDRLGRQKVLVAGLLIFALVYLGFAGIGASWQLWPLFGVYGLYIAATDGVGKALAVDLVPVNIRATAIGFLGTVTGVATLIASSVAGLLCSGIGHGAAFAYGAAGALVGAVLLARLPREKVAAS
jgi:MFS family permease